MASLKFTCPQTGEPIDPGIDTDEDSLRLAGDVTMRLPCPHCEDEHAFPVTEGHFTHTA